MHFDYLSVWMGNVWYCVKTIFECIVDFVSIEYHLHVINVKVLLLRPISDLYSFNLSEVSMFIWESFQRVLKVSKLPIQDDDDAASGTTFFDATRCSF